MNEEGNIFCDNCGNIRSWSDCMGGTYYNCKKALVVKSHDTAISTSRTMETPEEKNKSNNCGDYTRRHWWQFLYANTYG